MPINTVNGDSGSRGGADVRLPGGLVGLRGLSGGSVSGVPATASPVSGESGGGSGGLGSHGGPGAVPGRSVVEENTFELARRAACELRDVLAQAEHSSSSVHRAMVSTRARAAVSWVARLDTLMVDPRWSADDGVLLAGLADEISVLVEVADALAGPGRPPDRVGRFPTASNRGRTIPATDSQAAAAAACPVNGRRGGGGVVPPVLNQPADGRDVRPIPQNGKRRGRVFGQSAYSASDSSPERPAPRPPCGRQRVCGG